jgi:hypothetical protein
MNSNEHTFSSKERLALFQRKEVRRVVHGHEWWFVITDVVAALTYSDNPQAYFKNIRRRDLHLADALKRGGQIAPPLGLAFNIISPHKPKLAIGHGQFVHRHLVPRAFDPQKSGSF